VSIVHIPYRGSAGARTDVLGGQIERMFDAIPTMTEHIKAGKVKALATTGRSRSTILPEVPTMAEAGVKNVDVYSWQGVAGPKGLPADLRTKFHAAVVAALNDEQVKQQFTSVGLEVVGNSIEQFTSFQQQEFARWKKLIEARKITAD
jgi:tripartite-type tricarboxylate transporter receptor subunit TctC